MSKMIVLELESHDATKPATIPDAVWMLEGLAVSIPGTVDIR